MRGGDDIVVVNMQQKRHPVALYKASAPQRQYHVVGPAAPAPLQGYAPGALARRPAQFERSLSVSP